MGCPKLHITEHKLLLDTIPSSPWKQNSKGLKNSLSLCSSFDKTCAGSYRFGFNGQENEPEITGSNSHINFGDRMLDVRTGRWNCIYSFKIMSLVNNIKQLREQKGMLQKQVASEIGLGISHYNKIENGQREASVKILEKLAKLYGTTIDRLYIWKENCQQKWLLRIKPLWNK